MSTVLSAKGRLSPAQARFMARFEKQSLPHAPSGYGEEITVCSMEKATAKILTKRGLIEFSRRSDIGVTYVRKAA